MGDRTVTINAGNVVGKLDIELFEKGTGDPLVYLHGFYGTGWNDCLEDLAADFRVLAPRAPGFGASTNTEAIVDFHEFTHVLLDILDGLGVERAALVGHSLGGMFAAEIAAMQPSRFSHVVLISPFGLFDVSDPIPDFFTFRPRDLAKAMYHDPTSPTAKSQHEGPASLTEDPDPGDLIEFQLERAKSLGQTAKWLWPVPNRGLNKRLHRIKAPTLVIWGAEDGIIPPSYAEQFAAGLPNARVETVADAAHQVPIDEPLRTARLIRDFCHG